MAIVIAKITDLDGWMRLVDVSRSGVGHATVPPS